MKYMRVYLLCVVLVFVCIDIPSARPGTRPQVDLSVNVSTAPAPFDPGGIMTVTMEVHNAGPDIAGAALPGEKTIIVFEHGYDITNSPPPYELFEPATGCSAYAEESEPIFPGPHFFYLFSFRFDSIGPGESRVCTYRLRVVASTQSFDTSWLAHTTNDDDINPANDQFAYSFVAAAPIATSVPSGSLFASIALLLGMLIVGAWGFHSAKRVSVR